MLVSIIITNRNYGEYIGQAIDSALNQTYTPIEVIVVDDGSEDDSREIISRFGTRVRSINKQWQGQCSCFNAGFAQSSGNLVIFLDADDMLMPDAVAHHVACHSNPRVVKSSGYLEPVNADGFSIGGRIPGRLFPSGDYKAHFFERGPGAYRSAFTSGNAWSRWFLKRVLPLPHDDRIGADGYLTAIDGFFGNIESIQGTVARYRIHGRNKGPWLVSDTRQYLRRRVNGWEHRIEFAKKWAERLGLDVDADAWTHRNPRMVLMKHTSKLIGEAERGPQFWELVSAPYRSSRYSLSRSAALTFAYALSFLLPLSAALRLTRRLLNLDVLGSASGEENASR
jgi:glycosyltransferase involved in cell wall biosynthesis